jgi:hypothetical protein
MTFTILVSDWLRFQILVNCPPHEGPFILQENFFITDGWFFKVFTSEEIFFKIQQIKQELPIAAMCLLNQEKMRNI